MNTRTGIGTETGGEVVAEVGTDMTVTGTTGVKEITDTGAEAAVQVLTTAKTVEGADMMMSGVVVASPMGGMT